MLMKGEIIEKKKLFLLLGREMSAEFRGLVESNVKRCAERNVDVVVTIEKEKKEGK